VRKRISWAPFYTKSDQCTKTGSANVRRESTQKERCVFRRSASEGDTGIARGGVAAPLPLQDAALYQPTEAGRGASSEYWSVTSSEYSHGACQCFCVVLCRMYEQSATDVPNSQRETTLLHRHHQRCCYTAPSASSSSSLTVFDQPSLSLETARGSASFSPRV
jgi:hypothetical protein